MWFTKVSMVSQHTAMFSGLFQSEMVNGEREYLWALTRLLRVDKLILNDSVSMRASKVRAIMRAWYTEVSIV